MTRSKELLTFHWFSMARILQGPIQLRNVDMLTELSARPRLDSMTTAWHDICWAKCHRAVRKLQVRIAKAYFTRYSRILPGRGKSYESLSRVR
jgi:hypothetical protein